MRIRKMTRDDLPAALALMEASTRAGETLYEPLTERTYDELFTQNPNYDGSFDIAAEEDGRLIGFISGIVKHVFLPRETPENTPGYLTLLFVDAACRGRGVGAALLSALEDAFRAAGKREAAILSTNPIDLRWRIPGTPGHDHNNAPGVDMDCPGYPFFEKHGYTTLATEVAMYLNMSEYRAPDDLSDRVSRLQAEGIQAGRYDPALSCDFDRMCDRVGSEYWRQVLKTETTSAHPRVILAAVKDGYMVGFTGPVDKEPSGRGWFTGICTDPMFEKRGIATVLFNRLMQEFVREGAAFSTLFTGTDNHAQRLYLRTGFQVKRQFAIMKKSLEDK